MKREYLKELGVADDVIDKIMAENGKDIESLKTVGESSKAMIADLQKQVADRDIQLETLKKSAGNSEELQKQIATLQEQNKTAQSEYSANLKKLTRQGEIKDLLATKKFVNEETKEYYVRKLEIAVDDEANKGKSYSDLLDSFTKDDKGEYRPNIFISEDGGPNPPPPGGGDPPLNDDSKLSDADYYSKIFKKKE